MTKFTCENDTKSNQKHKSLLTDNKFNFQNSRDLLSANSPTKPTEININMEKKYEKNKIRATV